MEQPLNTLALLIIQTHIHGATIKHTCSLLFQQTSLRPTTITHTTKTKTQDKIKYQNNFQYNIITFEYMYGIRRGCVITNFKSIYKIYTLYTL